MRTSLLLIVVLACGVARSEEPAWPFGVVDLQLVANRRLDEVLNDDAYQGDDLAELPRGRQEFGGVLFNVGEGLVQVRGRLLPDRPERVAIPIRRHFQTLHVLQGAGWGAFGGPENRLGHWVPDGLPIGYYEFDYADGSSAAFPIVYGVDTRDWWGIWDDFKPVERAKVAWRGTNKHLRGRQEAAQTPLPLRLFLTTLENPHPESEVTQIELVSLNQTATPFVVAMTAEGMPIRSDKSIAWKPDGKQLALACTDGTIKLLPVEGGEPTVLKGHADSVSGVAWNPDGSLLASSSSDGTVRIWNAGGTMKKILEGHGSPVACVDWSPTGDRIVSGDLDRAVCLWDEDGTSLRTIEAHYCPVCSVAWNTDGSQFGSAGHGTWPQQRNDDLVRAWLRSGEPAGEADYAAQGVLTVSWALAPGAEPHLAWGGLNKTVTIQQGDPNANPDFHFLQFHSVVRSIAWQPTGSRWVAGLQSGEIILYRDIQNEISRRKVAHEPIISVAWRADGRQFAALTASDVISLWEIDPDGERLSEVKKLNAPKAEAEE